MSNPAPNALERVREARKKISEHCHGNPEELVEFYMREQEHLPNTVSSNDPLEPSPSIHDSAQPYSPPRPPKPKPFGPVEEVQRIQARMAEECGYDPDAYFEMLLREQEKLKAEGVSFVTKDSEI